MSYKGKQNYQMILVLIILMLFTFNNIFAKAEEEDVVDILVISSYNQESYWEKELLKYLNKGIKRNFDKEVNIRIEHLTGRVSNRETYFNSKKQMLNAKYEDINTDLVILMSHRDFGILKDEVVNEESVFYQMPMVFVGAQRESELSDEQLEYITGVFDDNVTGKLINLIINLHEDVKRINLIANPTNYEYWPEEKVNMLELVGKILHNEVEIKIIQSEYIEDIISELEQENSQQVNIIGSTYLSKTTGEPVLEEDVLARIKKVSKNPVYTYNEMYIKLGAIGGVVPQAEALGLRLAEMVVQTLEGNKPEVEISRGEYYFNYKEIYNEGIDIKKIPKSSVIMGKAHYQLLVPRYMKYMIIGLEILLLSIGGYLVYYIYKQRQRAKNNKKLYEMAKEREQLRIDFITSMSHDLKAPINIIRSIVQLLASVENEVEHDYLLEKLKLITNNSNRLLRLVNNLIDVTKLEGDNCQLKLRNSNLVEVVEDILLGTRDYMKQKEINFLFDTEEEEIIIAIDREKIERVILNLISNAIKFTPRLGEITAYIERIDDEVSFSITDTGIGIPEHKLEHIFCKFYQIDNTLTHANEGSGIGLCIAKELIKWHEGSISVESQEGKGTKFTVRLPIREVEETAKKEFEVRGELSKVIQLELSDI